MNALKKYAAELIGTMVLVFMGCGTAVVIGTTIGGGLLPVALAFGLSIVALAYVIGPISGCHVNPAVSLAMALNKKISWLNFVGYVVSQLIGAIIGAALLKLIIHFGVIDQTGMGLGANGFGYLGWVGACVVEIILTAIFVFTILGVTSDENKASVAGIVIGLTLAFVHIIGIRLTGTSVNPARSFGPALLAGGEALRQVWVFLLAPLVGAVVAWALFKLVEVNKR